MPKPVPHRYALTLRLNTKRLKNLYSKHFHNAYQRIKTHLGQKGFTQKGKLYIAPPHMDFNACLNAVKQVARKLKWLAGSLEYMRAIRIEEPVELLPVLKEMQR